jgi:hypothetical protein
LIPFNLHEFYVDLNRKGIIFCFSGPISQDVIEGIGGTLKQKMEIEDTDLNTSQKVFSIFVEQMQNIVNYSADRIIQEDRPEGEIRLGVLIVGKEEGHFYVLCGNKISREFAETIRAQLDTVARMNKDELKQLYRERRKMAPQTDVKGTGLGFIDIARKATRPIEFDFFPVDADFVFYTIKAVI